MTPGESRRNERRRSWLPVAADAGVEVTASPPPRPRDPLLTALPASVDRFAVVIEASAIRNSPIGDQLIDCLFGEPKLARFRDAGFDPLTQIDRIAVADDAVFITGDLKDTRWMDALARERAPQRAAYGPHGELFEVVSDDGTTTETLAGVWKGQLLIFDRHRDTAQVKRVLDRLDGAGPSRESALAETQAFGELYGVVKSDGLRQPPFDEFLRLDDQLGGTLRRQARQIELHMDISSDVGLVADIQGTGEAGSETLRLGTSATLALARKVGRAAGEDDLAELFEGMRTVPGDGGASFRLEAGLSNALVSRWLKSCVESHRADEAARAARAAAVASDAGRPR
jgi:hypothetical protein